MNVVSVGENLSAVDELVAISGGAADMVTASIPALLNAKAAGLDVIGVADMQSVLPEQPLLEFYVREDSSIRTVADARGKTWAVNNFKAIFHYMALTALAKAGVPEDTVRFTRLFFTEQIVALEKGQVDIIGVPEPFASFVRNNYAGKFRRLTTVLDIAGPKQLVLYTTNSRVDKDAVQRFIAAIQEAVTWSYTHQDVARKIMAKWTGLNAKDILVVKFQPDMRVVVEDCVWWQELLRQRGDLQRELPTLPCSNAYNPK